MRDIYEVPAAAILLLAHAELEKLVGTIHQNQLKPMLDQRWAYLVYAGLWWEPLRSDLDAYMDAANSQVTGTIGIKLYKGSARVVTRSSPNAVYDAQLATFAESGRPVLAGGLARLHRAVVAAVADGVEVAGRSVRGRLSLDPVGSFNPMGYKVLGYMVWQGTKWYVRRRAPGTPPKAALAAGVAGIALAGAGGALVAHRRSSHSH